MNHIQSAWRTHVHTCILCLWGYAKYTPNTYDVMHVAHPLVVMARDLYAHVHVHVSTCICTCKWFCLLYDSLQKFPFICSSFATAAIQCKGCMLIRFLSCPNYLTSKPLCTAIAKVVIAALSKRSDIRLQMEVRGCLWNGRELSLSSLSFSLSPLSLSLYLFLPPSLFTVLKLFV